MKRNALGYIEEEGWFVVENARVLHFFKERRLKSPCFKYNRTQIIGTSQEAEDNQILCKKCSTEITKRHWNLDKSGQELLHVMGKM